MTSLLYSALFANCPEDWHVYPLDEHVFLQEGPGILAKDFRSCGIPLLRLSGLGGKFATLKGCNYLDSDTVQQRWNHFRLVEDDIITSSSASFGRTSTVGRDIVGSVFYTGIIRFRPKTKRIRREFINLFLQSFYFEEQARSFASGSVIQHFGPSHLRQMAIALPPLKNQDHIIEVMGALDDKIELNRLMNETLEAMGREIFKDWFVDFGPVRAKAEHRPPYLARETWGLFPNALDGQDRPNGWSERSLHCIAEFVNGAAYKDMHFSPERDGLPVIKIAELKSGVTASTKFTIADLGSRYKIDTKEILFSWSGNPDTSIDTFIWDDGPACLNQHIFRVRENGGATRAMIYFQLKQLKPVFVEIARNKQTIGLGHVTTADIKSLKVCDPPPAVANAFQEIVAPIFEGIVNNLLENRTLENLRNLLLPRLMSGEIRLREVEKLVEKVS